MARVHHLELKPFALSECDSQRFERPVRESYLLELHRDAWESHRAEDTREAHEAPGIETSFGPLADP